MRDGWEAVWQSGSRPLWGYYIGVGRRKRTAPLSLRIFSRNVDALALVCLVLFIKIKSALGGGESRASVSGRRAAASKRVAEQSSSRTAEYSSSRAAEQPSSRAAEQLSS